MTERIALTHFSDDGAPAGDTVSEETAQETEQEMSATDEQPETPANEEEKQQPEDDGQKKLLSMAKQKLLDEQKDSIKKSWDEDAEEIRKIYPSFDVRSEMKENTKFGELLRAGVSLKNAYEVTHLEDILAAAMRYAAQKASEKTANSIASGSTRPAENGIMNSAPSVTRTDVRSLTEKDILKILDRVSKGETVSF